MKENKEIKLLPCPFCGGKAVLREYCDRRIYKYSFGCRNCLCDFGGHKTIEEAIKSWNTRSPKLQELDEGELIRMIKNTSLYVPGVDLYTVKELAKAIVAKFGTKPRVG